MAGRATGFMRMACTINVRARVSVPGSDTPCGVQTLEHTNRGLGAFVRHVEEMKGQGRFKGAVYGPIGTEVRMLPGVPAHAAAALENCVPKRVWSAFVVEHSEDQALIRECAPPPSPPSHFTGGFLHGGSGRGGRAASP